MADNNNLCPPVSTCPCANQLRELEHSSIRQRELIQSLEKEVNSIWSDIKNNTQRDADQRVALAGISLALEELRKLNQSKGEELQRAIDQQPTQTLIQEWIDRRIESCAAEQHRLMPGTIDTRLTVWEERTVKRLKTLLKITIPLSIVGGIAIAALLKADPGSVGGLIRGILRQLLNL